MTDSADWLPYAIVRSQPVASIVTTTQAVLATSGALTTVLVALDATKQTRLLRLDLRSRSPSPGRFAVFSPTGATLSGQVDPFGYVKLVDDVPVDFPANEELRINGDTLWSDVVLDIALLYLRI